MGGCCCSSRKTQLRGTPIYYYCPPVLEEHESLTSNDAAATALTARFLVELNLETSIPDTYRSPPAPLPYDVVFGHLQSPDSESVQETFSGSFETLPSCGDLKESDPKMQLASLLALTNKSEVSKTTEANISAIEEEDVCPICLDDYNAENPKDITKCEHHFHLSCILEWMERSDSCPICDQEMIFDPTFN